jgi:hypothetical protein
MFGFIGDTNRNLLAPDSETGNVTSKSSRLQYKNSNRNHDDVENRLDSVKAFSDTPQPRTKAIRCPMPSKELSPEPMQVIEISEKSD